MTLEFRSIPIDDAEVRAQAVGSGHEITARVLRYGVRDAFGTTWQPGVFRRSLESGKVVPLVDMHAPDSRGQSMVIGTPVGVLKDYEDRSDGLMTNWALDDFDAVPEARRVFAQVQPKPNAPATYGQWSVGFKRLPGGFSPDPDGKGESMFEADLDHTAPAVRGAVPGTGLVAVRAAITPATLHDLGRAIEAREISFTDAVRLLHVLEGRSEPEEPELDEQQAAAELRASIGIHHTATSTAAWDGSAMMTNCPGMASDLRGACAWQDGDGGDSKNAYKFIHHMVGSDGKVGAANVTACRTGIGVLNGGRGGTTIPDGDRKGVYAHLEAHLRDAGMEPPEMRAEPLPEVHADGEMALARSVLATIRRPR